MTCKECLHCDVCCQESLATDISPYVDYSIRNDVENECENFIDKDKVVAVKRGEWVDKPTGAYGRWQSWCTACGKHSGIGGIESNRHKPFCPNCGADMRGKKDEEM